MQFLVDILEHNEKEMFGISNLTPDVWIGNDKYLILGHVMFGILSECEYFVIMINYFDTSAEAYILC